MRYQRDSKQTFFRNCTDYIKPTESKQTTYAEIYKLIRNLPLNKASGLDNISVSLLKEAVPIVTQHLTFIINLSIAGYVFTDKIYLVLLQTLQFSLGR